jgi:hypothetical protein
MMKESVFNPTNGHGTALFVRMSIVNNTILQTRVLIQLAHEVDNFLNCLLGILFGGNDILGIGIQNLINLVFNDGRVELNRTNAHVIYLQSRFFQPFSFGERK